MTPHEEGKEQQYRKKPVVVSAYQTNVEMQIPTLEGMMTALPGDYIIRSGAVPK